MEHIRAGVMHMLHHKVKCCLSHLLTGQQLLLLLLLLLLLEEAALGAS